MPSPFNPNERTVQLLDLLRLSSSNLIIATYQIYQPALATREYFFYVDRPMRVVGVYYCHTVAETTSGSMLLSVQRINAGNIPGSGSGVALAFNGRAAAAAVQSGTVSSVNLFPGDRLSVSYDNAPTELRGVHVTVYMVPAAP
jgi:hypothetical protein